MLQSPHFRGYTALASEQTAGQADLREQFDIMREDTVLGLPTHNALWRRLIGPNQWPTALPALKPALLGVQQQFTAVLTELLHAMLESLQLDATALDHTIVDGPYQHLKIIRYPAIRQQNNNGQNSQAHSSSRQGVGAHKDPGYLTLVMQDEQPGLEVQTADGWLLVEPKPGALVVNIGELLELASNGYLKATVHRVTSPTQRDRYSCAFFMAAQLDATVPVLPLPAALAANAAGISTDPANPLLREVGANTLKGRLRSHRDVAAIHYPEWSQAS
jgi:isopenicillin N synthase-like dioxygenase